jgi:adenylosuccinate lyase
MPNLILPGNPRYQPKQLVPIWGYDNLYRSVAEVEIAAMETLGDIGVIPPSEIAKLTPGVKERLLNITTTEVDKVEREVTSHDIRAWVQIAKTILPEEMKRWVHVPLTSYDVLDTARSLQFYRAHQTVVRKMGNELIGCLAGQAEKYADQVQIGRTHGQHALPITVGFWFATILNRVVGSLQSANKASEGILGKISGPVGCYNAQVGLGITARCGDISFEERVLSKLGLKPAPISTQILPPEPLFDYLASILKLSTAIGQFGRDARHLMRTEIGEICEPFEKGQVGSSAMPHKRNPINFENFEGMALRNEAEFLKIMLTMISEHQRDLVGSCVARDYPRSAPRSAPYPIMVVNTTHQLNTLLRRKKPESPPFIARIAVDIASCQRNLKMQGDKILGEPMQLVFGVAGLPGDAHSLVNDEAMPLSQQEGIPLLDACKRVLARDPEVSSKVLGNIPQDTMELLLHPEKYTGLAAQKARQIAGAARAYLAQEGMSGAC